MSKLKNSKSTGVDDIDNGIIKLITEDIIPALTHIINLSITHSDFPSMWKIAKVYTLAEERWSSYSQELSPSSSPTNIQ